MPVVGSDRVGCTVFGVDHFRIDHVIQCIALKSDFSCARQLVFALILGEKGRWIDLLGPIRCSITIIESHACSQVGQVLIRRQQFLSRVGVLVRHLLRRKVQALTDSIREVDLTFCHLDMVLARLRVVSRGQKTVFHDYVR